VQIVATHVTWAAALDRALRGIIAGHGLLFARGAGNRERLLRPPLLQASLPITGIPTIARPLRANLAGSWRGVVTAWPVYNTTD
jgi:hypothetical protein